MTLKQVGLYTAAALILISIGRYTTPTKTVVKTEIKEVIKEVEKKTEDSVTTKHNNRVYVSIVRYLPDGSKTVEKRIVDNGFMTIEAASTSETQKETDKETKSEKIVERSSPVVIYGLGSVNMSDFTPGPDYGLGVQKQILGPIHMGMQFQKSGTLGVTLGLGF